MDRLLGIDCWLLLLNVQCQKLIFMCNVKM